MWPLINWKSVECSWFLGQEVTSYLFKAEKRGQSIATLGWSLAESLVASATAQISVGLSEMINNQKKKIKTLLSCPKDHIWKKK